MRPGSARAIGLPGPSAPGWVQTMRFARSPFEYVRACARRYGDAFTMRMAGMGDVAMFAAPAAVREIFGLPADSMRNGNDVVRYLLHERSVIFLEGEEHRAARKLLTPPFHGARLAGAAPLFLESTRRACEAWSDGDTVNLHRAFQHATFEALLSSIFGEAEIPGFDRLRSELLDYVNGQLTNGMFLASVAFGPRLYEMLRARTARARASLERGAGPPRLGLFARRGSNLAAVETALELLIRDRKAGARGRPDGGDALGRMLDSGAMSDDDVARQVLTLLVAGHDTTSLALSWLTIHVLERPDVRARLLDELRGARAADGLDPTVVAELPYLGAVVAESLRHAPIASFVPRRMERDAVIAGVEIPAGSCVAANILAAHARPESWGDPEVFRPERFLEGEPVAGSFIPFGGGVRRCLGAAFATAEMRFVLAALLSEWEMEIAPGYRARPAVHGFLIGPAKPLRVRVRRRTRA